MKSIGILGGGQLARMLALAAHPLGLRCRVYDPAENPPAAAVAPHVRGAFDDPEALGTFLASCDVVTYELELASNLPIPEDFQAMFTKQIVEDMAEAVRARAEELYG